MKNEQQNNQTGKQDQNLKKSSINSEAEEQQKKDDWTNKSTGKNKPTTSPQSSASQSQTTGNEKSNIAVDNEGKIGNAHDQWNNDNNNRNEQDRRNNNDQQKDGQIKNDKTVTEPEIDAPIYEPEKTEKKIPQMGSNK